MCVCARVWICSGFVLALVFKKTFNNSATFRPVLTDVCLQDDFFNTSSVVGRGRGLNSILSVSSSHCF